MRKYLNAFLGIIFVFVFAFVLHLIRAQISETPNYPTRDIGANEELVNIEINAGDSGLIIAKQLEQKGPQTEADAQRIQTTLGDLGNTKQANQFMLDVPS